MRNSTLHKYIWIVRGKNTLTSYACVCRNYSFIYRFGRDERQPVLLISLKRDGVRLEENSNSDPTEVEKGGDEWNYFKCLLRMHGWMDISLKTVKARFVKLYEGQVPRAGSSKSYFLDEVLSFLTHPFPAPFHFISVHTTHHAKLKKLNTRITKQRMPPTICDQ